MHAQAHTSMHYLLKIFLWFLMAYQISFRLLSIAHMVLRPASVSLFSFISQEPLPQSHCPEHMVLNIFKPLQM